MTDFAATDTFDDVDASSQDIIDGIEQNSAASKEFPGGVAVAELTIATGVIVPVDGGGFSVDTEANAAADDLTNISTANIRDGGLLWLLPESTSRVVTVKHNAGGVGEVDLIDGQEHVMDVAARGILLQRRGVKFYEVMRQGGRQINLGGTNGFTGFKDEGSSIGIYINGTLAALINADGTVVPD